MQFGLYDSQFGRTCLAFDEDSLYAVLFVASKEEAVNELKRRFHLYDIEENIADAKKIGDEIFVNGNLSRQLKLIGTPFQQSVWKALLEIPEGETKTYAQIAESIGRPKAYRAVGSAIGANHLAYLVPCHRVLRTDGGIGGYHWGVKIKEMILQNEVKGKNLSKR
ncbi:MAG: hypothetical protein BGO29_15845 [Bacteroidales bacterium 36-12]|nr:MAG: hypothetical protein BGO29_15845 [Bacteroidales bacterium 36-12]